MLVFKLLFCALLVCIFYSASVLLAMQTAVLARGILSVRLFVHPSVTFLSRRMKIRSCKILLVSGKVEIFQIIARNHPH